MATENQISSDLSPVAKTLLEWAEYWYPISWKGVLIGGVITAVGACATIAFLLLQWRTTTIREAHSEWRTSSLELQTANAKTELGKAQADIANANERIAEARADTANAVAETAKANAAIAEANRQADLARLEQERLKAQLAWRRLGALETRAFIERITGKIEEIILFNLSPDPETVSYMVDLNSAFTRAGVKVNARSGLTGTPYFGIGLEGGSEPGRAAVIEAFAAAGVIVRPEAPFGELTLIVGSKPPPP